MGLKIGNNSYFSNLIKVRINFTYSFCDSIKIHIFATLLRDAPTLTHATQLNGGLAQLARALAWHARGHRFDPDILHKQ